MQYFVYDFNKKIWKSWYQLWMNDTKHYYAYVYDDEIKKLDEYWGEYGKVPQWRKEMKIGRKIKS